ncbi:putative ribonuclease H-like domain-containing protein [Tanacetum coccineum]|uniref:Ribonuclease H-like domain-containing protein n=1 Tax=Tanacetum coccineum TaxID=301880 RepID=A0ABQ4YE61_9ASTR
MQDFKAELDNLLVQQKEGYANSTNRVSTVSPSVSAAGHSFENADDLPTDPLMHDLEDTANLLNSGIFSGAYDDEDVGAKADLNNLETTMNVSPIPTTRIHKDQPKNQIIEDINSATQTRRMTKISEEHAMKVWRLVDLPKGKHAIGTKWVYRNKKDERGIVVRNKARLVAPGYTQEEGIDYDKMNVKSAFLYGTIEEELYVCQPPSFEDPQFPDKVYKLEKALYGLHQAPRAWYETFSTYLLENRFRRGTIDKTLFIKKDKGDILLVQLKQKDDGIFISQDKYVADILKKFDFSSVKTGSTPTETNKALLKDEEAEDVDVYLYRSLMYLTASRPDIMFDVCACARDSPFDLEAFSDSDYAGASLDRKSTTGDGINDEFGVKTDSYKVNAARQDLVLLGEVTVDGKEFTITEASIRRHLQIADVDGISVFPTTKSFVQLSLMGYVLTDDKLTFQKGFSGEQTPLFPSMLAIQAEEGEGLGHPSEPQSPPSTAQPIPEEPIPNVVSSSYQKTQTPRQALNQVTNLPQTSEPIPNVPDEVIYEEWDDRVERDTTTAASLDATQASGNITKTQSTTIPNVPLPQGIDAGGSPRCQEATGGSIAQTRFERVPTPPLDSPLPRVNTLGSDEGSMSLQELMVLCTKLFSKVESLEADLKQTKQVYGAAYSKLIMKVKKLKKTVKSNQARRRAKIVVSDEEEDLEDSSKQGRIIEEIDQDAGVTLVTPTHSQEDQPEDQLGVFSAAKVLVDADKNVHTYTRRRRAVSTGSGGISTASRLFSTDEESVSTAGASMPVSTAGTIQEVNKDKGKGIMTESESKQIKTKLQQRQERAGYEATVKLQEQLDEEERQRIVIVHEEQLKRLSFDELKALFETTMRRVQTFHPIESKGDKIVLKLTTGSSKMDAAVELDHEGSKKQKTNEASGPVQEQPKEEETELP